MLSTDILLDDVSIQDRISGAVITFDRAAIHNTIEISSSDMELYASIDLSVGYGTARLKAVIGDNTMLFLLEAPIESDERSFTMRGRSLTALEGEGYTDQVYKDLVGYSKSQRKADTVVNEILTVQTASWFEENPDEYTFLTLYKGWSSSGYPIELIRNITDHFQLTLRSDYDGNFLVYPYYKIEPSKIDDPLVVLENGEPIVIDEPQDIIIDALLIPNEINEDLETGSKYNAIRMVENIEYVTPDIIIESGNYIIDEGTTSDVWMRLYWENAGSIYPPEESVYDFKINIFSTSGTIEGAGNIEQITEDVEFSGGNGFISYPIHSLITVNEKLSFVPGALTIQTTGDDETLSITYEKEGFSNTSIHTETVTFQDGTASVSRNIDFLVSVTWKGQDNGTPSFNIGEKELRISEQGGIAEIKYYASYNRLKLTGATVDNVLIAVAEPEQQSTVYKIEGAENLIYAPDDMAHGSKYGAQKVLWDSYDKRNYSFVWPLDREITDGMTCLIKNYPNLDDKRYLYVTKATLKLEKVKSYYEIEAVELLWQN